MNGVWQKAADRMRDTLGQVSYETWIGPLSFVAMNNGTATIEAPNRFFRDWVSDRYLDLLRGGWAKAYLPDAAAIHSHDYSLSQQLRRSFDEWRGLREVYGWREPLSPRHLIGQLRGGIGEADRELVRLGVPPTSRAAVLAQAGAHRAMRLTGAILGSRADRLPGRAQRVLSLERRSGVDPLDLDTPAAGADLPTTQ